MKFPVTKMSTCDIYEDLSNMDTLQPLSSIWVYDG